MESNSADALELQPALEQTIQQAAALLEAGGLVAFPTETVYGLGADAENEQAIAKIYQAKGRPATHPVIVHVALGADLRYWAESVPDAAQRLIAAFWPGPLTLILKRAADIPAAVSGGQPTIGLRCPSHPVAQALLRIFKNGQGGLAAPSANKFGHVSPTTAQHVRDEFGVGPDSALQLILEGGASEVGIESTIVDLSRIESHGAVLLRPGHISAEHIAAVLGSTVQSPDVSAPRVSGSLDAHYAPRTPLALIESSQLIALIQKLQQVFQPLDQNSQIPKVPPVHSVHPVQNAGPRLAVMTYTENSAASISLQSIKAVVAHYAASAQPVDYARELYAALRTLDSSGADIILIETPPQHRSWQAINDRLRRAAYGSAVVLQRLLDTAGTI